MSKLKFLKAAVCYEVPVPEAVFLRLIKRESPFGEGARKNDPDLMGDLEEIPGVDNIEYDGHFGASIYFRLDADHDTPENHERITACINSHLKRR